MTDHGVLLAQIPYLRRHARLLCGSQALGDEYVRMCLEMAVQEPQWLEGDDLRLQLFKAFHRVWRSVNATMEDDGLPGGADLSHRIQAGLQQLPEAERQALVLVVIEGFTYAQVAEILGTTPEAVRTTLGYGRARLDSQVSTTVLIIEDEQLIAADIARIVEDMGHRVVGTASTSQRSIELARSLKPGLMLVDIKLEDERDGISAAREILEADEVPVVFVTGYPERLLTGEGLEPAFVVSKPFADEVLKVTIANALATYAAPGRAARHRAEFLAKLRTLTGERVSELASRAAP